jgi:RNA polymerase sigma factor (sigma-70 family)
MYKVIRAMAVSHEGAQDVIQDILLRWTRQLEAGRNLPAPEALTEWFRTVARFAAIAHVRRLRGKYRDAEIESARRRFAAEQRTPLDILALRELPEVIRSILKDRVTPESRNIFYLRWRGETYAEIADQLNKRNAEAVRNVMRQVVAIMLEELTRLGWAA